MARQSTITAFLSQPNSTMTRQGIARSASSESTLSCITLNNDALPAVADEPLGAGAMSSTPPTSLETSSQISDHPKQEEQAAEKARAAPARSRRARASVATYNENALSRSTRRAPEAAATASPRRRDLSGKTLVTGGKDATKDETNDLVRDSIQLLDLDWRVDALPGEKMELDGGKLPTTKLGRRSSLLKRATSAVGKSTTALGKRARDLIEAGKTMGRRSSLRPRDVIKDSPALETPEPESMPAAKKRRLTEVVEAAKNTDVPPKASEMKSTPSTRQAKKIYLKQGLYVGQELDFDARFNPGQKLKRKQKESGKEDEQRAPRKKRTILPMPMFAGKRAMDTGRDFKMPFDIFNPLPPGQPKPDEWRKTQRNVFVGDAAEYWKIHKNTEYSTCLCTPETGCDEDCINRMMFYECDKNNCSIGAEHCTNRSFSQLRERVKKSGKYNIGVEVMKTENKGYGVRSCRTFGPGQIIVEYTGEIITQEECDTRMHTIYKSNECFYLMMFDQNMIIDATRGSIARFVNHSCEPNCRMVKWTVEGKPRMALFAGDNGIMTGEELTYDYNFDPFSAKNIQECHCGTPSCRGVLGPKPKDREPKDALKPLVEKSSGGARAKQAKRKLKEVVEKGMEDMKSKKRRLSADMSTILKSNKEDRAARAALRADIKGAKSKRVAAKLTEKLSAGKRRGVVKAKASSRSLVSAKSGPSGKVVVAVTKKAGTARTATKKGAKSSAAFAPSVRSNVVRTVKGGKARGGKSIKVVGGDDVFDVPANED